MMKIIEAFPCPTDLLLAIVLPFMKFVFHF